MANSRPPVADRVAAATEHRRRGDYGRAEQVLGLALDEARGSADALLVAWVSNELGVLGKCAGRFADAEDHYRRALRVYLGTYGPEHDTVATSYHNLGGLAHARGDHARGEPLARRAVEIRTRLHGAAHPLVAADIAAWAALLDGCGRLDEAETWLRRALAAFPDGSEPYEVAVIRHNLAAVAHRRGGLAAAVEGYARALEIKEGVLGVDHPQLAPTLVGLATAQRRLGLFGPARAGYARAITLLSPCVVDDHPVLAAARDGLARTPGDIPARKWVARRVPGVVVCGRDV